MLLEQAFQVCNAAYLLKNHGFKVKVLEASEISGGRIASLDGFADYPIELGAEYIHGKDSVLYHLVKYLKLPVYKLKGEDYYYYNDNIMSEKKAKKYKQIKKVNAFFKNQWKYQKEEIEVSEFLQKKTFIEKTRNIMEAFSAEYGTTNDKLGMRSLAIEESMWHSGIQNYKFVGKYQDVFKEFLKYLEGNIVYKMPVSNINYNKKRIKLECKNKTTFKADKVVVTIPLTILKEKHISFNPELPKDKMEAIKTIGMEKGMKVFLKFKNRFWEKDMSELLGGYYCPVYLVNMTSEVKLIDKKNPENKDLWETRKHSYILTAFIMGDKAAYLGNYDQHQAAKHFTSGIRWNVW